MRKYNYDLNHCTAECAGRNDAKPTDMIFIGYTATADYPESIIFTACRECEHVVDGYLSDIANDEPIESWVRYERRGVFECRAQAFS